METGAATQAIAQVLNIALTEHNNTFRKWIDISFRIGSILPLSSLSMSIQNLGRLDIIIRTLESEFRLPTNQQSCSDTLLLAHSFLVQFSEVWISDAYEIIRLLRHRKLEKGEAFEELHLHLRLIRIPLNKHEIAGPPKSELSMQVMHPRPHEKPSVYDPKDPLRSIIVPRGWSGRSMGWCVTDVTTDKEHWTSYWLERQEISDRMLALWTLEENE